MTEKKITVEKSVKSTNNLLCKRCSCRLRDEKDSWEKELKAALDEAFYFNKKVAISIYSYRQRLLDRDNSFLSIKALIDSMKKGRLGIIEDDSPAYIEGPYYFQFVVKEKRRQRTEIVIKEIGA